MICVASVRAFLISSATRASASARSLRAFSAAERPSEMRCARSSIALVSGGQMNFIVNQMRIRKTIIWAMSVALMVTGRTLDCVAGYDLVRGDARSDLRRERIDER